MQKKQKLCCCKCNQTNKTIHGIDASWETVSVFKLNIEKQGKISNNVKIFKKITAINLLGK